MNGRREEALRADRADDARARSFGHDVLGPVLAEFSLRLWTYLSAIEQPDDACLLFCARGGLRLQLLHDLFARRTGLGNPLRAEALMISRLVAARLALARGHPAALDEIGREFEDASARQVAETVVQAQLALGPAWEQPFTRQRFAALLQDPAEAGPLHAALAEQNALFVEHLDRASGGRRRLVLCDTGLYGSTVRLLLAGMPERSWECVMLARANYKGFDTSHFRCTTGLLVEQDMYAPLVPRSALLRFWHLFEWVLEPDLRSVKAFARDTDGVPRANLEQPDWEARVEPAPGSMFDGVVAYFDQLSPAWPTTQYLADTDRAWAELRRVLRFPTRADAETLSIPDRSQDFGRPSLWRAPVSAPYNGLLVLRGLKRSLWREGDVALNFGSASLAFQAGLEAVQAARWAWRSMTRRQARPS